MGFLKRFFVGADPLKALRRAVQQKRWADALVECELLDLDKLAATERKEVENSLYEASEGLAELNLREGEACLRAGDLTRAAEHCGLAINQARSDKLHEAALEFRSRLAAVQPAIAVVPAASHGCGSGCSSDCSTGSKGIGHVPGDDSLDSHTRLELLLASFPPDWARRYAQKGEAFRKGFLLAHDGHEEKALGVFDQVPADERDDLYFFERGALLGRLGEEEKGCRDLEQALGINPEHLLAVETLVGLEISTGRELSAEKRLQTMLKRGSAPLFCLGRLAVIASQRNDPEAALGYGLQAMEMGSAEPDTVLLTATLLERRGRVEEAEAALNRLSGGGCSGTPNIPLAEFSLRHNKNLDKALESFKGALRNDPENPRWPLRIAQIYLAKGWKKDGLQLLSKTLGDPRLDPELQREGQALLHAAQ